MVSSLKVGPELKKHFMLTSANEVAEICKPLFDLLGINYFSMHRVYADGFRARLTTNAEWLEHYYTSKLYLNARLERHPMLYKDSVSLWDQWPQDDEAFYKVHQHMKDLYNKDHGFSVIKNRDTYMDVFILTAPSESNEVNSKYFRYLEEIQNFLGYFMSRAAHLIEAAHRSRFLIEMEPTRFTSDDGSSLQKNAALRQFYESIKLDALSLSTEQGLIKLTKREADCLMFLLKRKTSKEIGRKLGISSRTVESYLNSIKTKFNIHSTPDLIMKVEKSDIYECLNYRYLLYRLEHDTSGKNVFKQEL